jgi:hypothetical protein
MKHSIIGLIALAAAPVLASNCEAITSWVTVTAEAVTLKASSQMSSTFAYSTTKATTHHSTSTSVKTSAASSKTTATVPTSTTSTAVVVYETTAAVATTAPTTTYQATAKETTVTAEAVGTTTTSEKTSSTTAQAVASSTTAAAATGSSSSSSQSLGGSVTGEATFYGGNLAGGTCSFTTYTLPANIFGTAFSGSAWDAAAHCGECVKVTGPNGNSITAMVSLFLPLSR